MLEYESFVNLDLHKTGSTHLKFLFDRFVDEDVVFFKKHASVGARYNRNKLYVISIRNPLDQYISLYRYGLDEKGALFYKMRSKGLSYMYGSSVDKFKKWIFFVLDPNNANFLGEGYNLYSPIKLHVGFFSFRILKLIFPYPIKIFSGINTKNDICKKLENSSICQFCIRNEFLEKDFVEFLKISSSHIRVNPTKLKNNMDEIESLVYTEPKRNASVSIIHDINTIVDDPEVEEIIARREWVYKYFGY